MTIKKRQRKQAKQSKTKHAKPAKSPSLIASHPKVSIIAGGLLLLIGIYFLLTGMQNNAKFGLAMLFIIAGTATMIFGNLALPTKKAKPVK